MSNTAPQFIYFDIGNVLLTFDSETACRQMASLAGVASEEVRKILGDAQLLEGLERGEISEDEFYEIFCRRSGTRPDRMALLLAGADIFTLNVAIVPIVAHLKAARRRLGLCSNTCSSHWNVIRDGRYAVIQFFDVEALSFRIHARKPEAEMFEAAAALAGLPPSEILLVDDRPENVAGARAAGFHAVQYTSPPSLADELRRRGVEFNY